VDELPPLLAEAVTGSATVAVIGDGSTMTISGVSLDPIAGTLSDIYLRTPELLKNFNLRLTEATGSETQSFNVTSAEYDESVVDNEVLTLMVDASDGSLQQFIDTPGYGNVSYELIPRFFRISTGDELDELPNSASVQIYFHATVADQFGRPDEDYWMTIGDTTAGNEGNIYDVDDFETWMNPGDLQFFRFNIVFEVDNVDSDTEKVALDFVRIPLRF